GRLTLLKSVLGASPLYCMSIFKAPKGVLKEMESIRNKSGDIGDGSCNGVFGMIYGLAECPSLCSVSRLFDLELDRGLWWYKTQSPKFNRACLRLKTAVALELDMLFSFRDVKHSPVTTRSKNAKYSTVRASTIIRFRYHDKEEDEISLSILYIASLNKAINTKKADMPITRSSNAQLATNAPVVEDMNVKKTLWLEGVGDCDDNNDCEYERIVWYLHINRQALLEPEIQNHPQNAGINGVASFYGYESRPSAVGLVNDLKNENETLESCVSYMGNWIEKRGWMSFDVNKG
ncbi:hypothetical protein Tco_0590484, partial [Tanacetum coccineum]